MRRLVAICLGVIVGGVPIGAVALLTVEVLPRLRRRRAVEVDGVDVAARLLVLVGAGLPLISALHEVSASAPGLDGVVRRSRRVGSVAALAAAQGPMGPLLRRLADAAASGAPPEPAIRAYIDMERRRRHTLAVERARRLPVRLMIPMTLLLLPGFVLMVYGPAFIDLITSLAGPLTG